MLERVFWLCCSQLQEETWWLRISSVRMILMTPMPSKMLEAPVWHVSVWLVGSVNDSGKGGLKAHVLETKLGPELVGLFGTLRAIPTGEEPTLSFHS